MKLVSLFIHRPVMAWMMSLVIVLFGWLSFDRIGLDSYPDVTFPMLSVTTLYPGANPEIIDRSITQVLEAKLNAIDGLTHIQGRSLTGASQIFLTFDLKKDIDVAFNELQVKVNQALNLLPKEIRTPQISKMEAGSAPILWLSLQGDRTDDQLYDLANNVVKKSLETLEGVGEVVIGGYQERSVQVALNINRLNALHLSVVDVIRAFQHEHIQLPGGQLTHLDQEFLVKLDAEFHDLETLKAMPIVQRGATVITLKDIADVHYGAGKRRQLARFNGEPTLAVGLVKLSGSNTVHIIQNALQRVEEVVLPQLPTGVSLQIASNRASFIEKIIHSLEEHLVIGTLITALIIWLFLRSFRATAIISIAIPVSLLGAVWAMHLNGYTFNTMTLLAMLLLIGVVVDDAIVVLENIHRHMENWQNEHKKPLDGAARQAVSATATHQVMTAVIASTLTLVVIFSAVLFMEGIIGRFFKEFGLVVTVGVLISMWVSLTLIPMLSAHYLNTHQITNSFILNGFHKLFDWLERFYLKMLRWVLSAPKKILAAAILLFVASLGLVPLLGASFLPEQNQDSFIVNFKTPFGSSLSYTEKRLNVLENFIQKQPEVRTTFSTIGGGSAGKVNEGRIIVNLHPVGERQASMRQIMDRLSAHFAEIPGVKAYPSQVPMMSGQRGEPLRFVLQGDRLEELETLSHQLLKRLQNVPQLGGVDLELALNQPQIGFKIDRKKAASLGLTTQSIAQTINVLVGGSTIAKFSPDTGNSDRYDIRLNADAGEINQQSDFSKIFIKSQTGHLVSLDTVAQVISEPGAAVVPRYDLKYASYFYATPKVSLNKAVVLVQEQTDFLPKGYSVKMSGQAEELKKTSRFVKLALIMAVLLVYMVLASQFNHFWQPLLIMLTQPLAIIGGIFALWWADMTLNIFSMIGLLLLMGLVAKNGILLVDLTNQLRQEGKSPKEALLEACPVRLRPVLMTSLTVIVTMLPAALGLGAGNEANAPLSVAVIGGMISSTFLTLLVIPAAYLLMAKVQPNSVSIKEAIQSFIRICPGTSVWQRFRPSWRKAD